MNFKAVFHLISYLLSVSGLSFLLCATLSVYYQDPIATRNGFWLFGTGGLVGGVLLAWQTRGAVQLNRKDGFGVVALGWVAVTLFGALPYLFSGAIADPVSALFESVSGFTTTGASVMTGLEEVPRGILFWRALTQWYGGMGVLVLCVAILPFLGVGGMQVYRAEIPGPSKDRLTPRIATTAKLLWGIYGLMSLLQAALLMLAGMDWFDAVCHTFTTMSTGGFSTRTNSIAAFESGWVDFIIIVFMFMAGTNFALHFRALQGRLGVFYRNPEFRVYGLLWLMACLLVTFSLAHASTEKGVDVVRHGLFQVTSIMTTTGFATRDFNLWPLTSRFLLLLLMFVGGCGGSTAGGIKVVRISVLLKHIVRDCRKVLRPRSVASVKLGGEPISEPLVITIVTYVITFSLIFGAMSLLMTFYTPDLVSATSAVAASLGNIGPGLGAVGASETYAFIEAPGKLILMLCMLLGRLELYTVLLLFMPSFWKK